MYYFCKFCNNYADDGDVRYNVCFDCLDKYGDEYNKNPEKPCEVKEIACENCFYFSKNKKCAYEYIKR